MVEDAKTAVGLGNDVQLKALGLSLSGCEQVRPFFDAHRSKRFDQKTLHFNLIKTFINYVDIRNESDSTGVTFGNFWSLFGLLLVNLGYFRPLLYQFWLLSGYSESLLVNFGYFSGYFWSLLVTFGPFWSLLVAFGLLLLILVTFGYVRSYFWTFSHLWSLLGQFWLLFVTFRVTFGLLLVTFRVTFGHFWDTFRLLWVQIFGHFCSHLGNFLGYF